MKSIKYRVCISKYSTMSMYTMSELKAIKFAEMLAKENPFDEVVIINQKYDAIIWHRSYNPINHTFQDILEEMFVNKCEEESE